MSLYIRVHTSFYSHLKTIKLRARLGNDALWIPPRLWAFAADHRPSGILDGITQEELALLIGYGGDASSMLQALLHAGFLDSDPLRIHNWEAHNSYHSAFAERAKAAAMARWKGKDSERKGKDNETSNASSMLQASGGEEGLLVKVPSLAEMAEEIYQLYPHKVGKPAAIKAIVAAIRKTNSTFLRERTAAYAAAVKGTDTMMPHPSTWFNEERFNDDPETWVRRNPRAQPPVNPRNIGVAMDVEKQSQAIAAAVAAQQAKYGK